LFITLLTSQSQDKLATALSELNLKELNGNLTDSLISTLASCAAGVCGKLHAR